MKKALSVMLAVLMVVGLLAGCGGNDKTSGYTEDGRMIIRWMGFPIDGVGTEGSPIEKYIEEKFNVEIEPIFITYGEYSDKKAMMLAGDDIPDVIYEFDPKNVTQDAEQGFIAEVPYETIEKYAPDIYRVLNENEPKVWSYARVDGQNFGVPNLAYENNDVSIGLWRQDWLDNVGIKKVPETIDEMGEALRRFTKNDPDGNGKDDTYGMTGTISWNGMFKEIFGAYDALPFNWIETEDGEYVYGGLQSETVDALSKIAEWYDEGLIHPDFTTDTMSGTGKEKLANGKVGYLNGLGGYYDKTNQTDVRNLAKSINPKAVLTDAPPVKGPDGKSGGFVWGNAAHVVAFGRHLEKDQDKLAKILEILNTMVADEEVMLNVRIGEEGTHYVLKDGAKTVAEGIEFLPPYDDAETRKLAGFVDTFGSASFFMPVTPAKETYEKYSNAEKMSTNKAIIGDTVGRTDAFLKPDLLPSSADYFETLRNAQIKLMVEIITGEKPVDSYMPEFEKMWKQYGGETLEKEAKPLAEEINNMLKEVGVK